MYYICVEDQSKAWFPKPCQNKILTSKEIIVRSIDEYRLRKWCGYCRGDIQEIKGAKLWKKRIYSLWLNMRRFLMKYFRHLKWR